MLRAMASTAGDKGVVASLNTTSHGPLLAYLADSQGLEVVLAQETHVVPSRLGSIQGQAQDAGFKCMWAPAIPTAGAGSQGWVAVLVPSHGQVTGPPRRTSPISEDCRVVAALVHWGPGGFVAVSCYLRDGEGVQGANLATLWEIVKYLHELNDCGYD